MLSSYYEQDGITIYCGDCRDVLPSLERFDLLLTDPPYGIDIGATLPSSRPVRSGKRKTESVARWDKEHAGWLVESDIARQKIIWGGNHIPTPESTCWLVWNKKNECTTFADCELAWTNLPIAVRKFDWLWSGPYQERREHRAHPTQKPLALMKWCLSFVDDAETVIDPFMGSGTTLVAAKEAGLRAVGIEINEEYCQKAVERLRQGVLPFAG